MKALKKNGSICGLSFVAGSTYALVQIGAEMVTFQIRHIDEAV